MASLTISDNRQFFYVRCSFSEKEKAKKSGGRWDQSKKMWKFAFDLKILDKVVDAFDTDLSLPDNIIELVQELQLKIDSYMRIKKEADTNNPIDFAVDGLSLTVDGKTIDNPLFQYQRHGVKYGNIADGGFLLADQMGLGKSIQSIGIALLKKKSGDIKNCLIICPASVKYNWLEEIKKFTNETAIVVDGSVDERFEKWFSYNHFFKIVNYEIVARDLFYEKKFDKNGDLKEDKRIPGADELLNHYMDLIIVDECFHPDTRITLEDGSFTNIYEIVCNKTKTNVLSYNLQTKQIESKPIIGWYKNSVKQCYKLQTNAGTSYPSLEHTYLTENNIYTPVSKLQVGDKVYVRDQYCITNTQRQMLAGTLLGDGCLSRIKTGEKDLNKRTRLQMNHGFVQHDYVTWKSKFFQNVCNIKIVNNKGCGNKNSTCVTKPIIPFNLYSVFYIDDKKTVNQEWLNELTDLSLAVWYMDAGSVNKTHRHNKKYQKLYEQLLFINNNLEKFKIIRKQNRHEYEKWIAVNNLSQFICYKSIKEFLMLSTNEQRQDFINKISDLVNVTYEHAIFHTQGFKKKEVVFLSKILKNKWNINNRVFKVKNKNNKYYYSISTTSSGFEKLTIIIGKYTPDCMRYKLGKHEIKANLYSFNFTENCQVKPGVVLSPIYKIEKYKKPCMTYNVNVKDNHNYFAGGAVVSNCHYIKSHKSLRTKAVKKFQTKLKIGLTGTPLDGRLEELHSIMEFIKPGLFSTKSKFLSRYAVFNYFGAISGYKHISEVKELIEPYYIRRLKTNVLKDLPDKIYKKIYVDFDKKLKKIYNQLKKRKHEITEDKSAMETIIRCRQFCDFPELLKIELPSAKFLALQEVLTEVVGENKQKVIIFSQFKTVVYLLRDKLKKTYNVITLTGDDSAKSRVDICNKFNSDDNVDIIIMTEAGSTGLNLQAASMVIHFSDNYMPSIMKQREDRCVLEGQKIQTINGFKKIEDIVLGERVLTHKGRYKKVYAINKCSHRRETTGGITTQIICRRHNEPLLVTHNHKLLVYRNNKIIWLQAKDVMPRDILLEPKIKNKRQKVKEIFFDNTFSFEKQQEWNGGQITVSSSNKKYKNGIMSIELEDYNCLPVVEVKNYIEKNKKCKVYDLSVEEDHSFVVGRFTVHNCHRAGQKNTVTVLNFICVGTIEQNVIDIIRFKDFTTNKILDEDVDVVEIENTHFNTEELFKAL